MKKLLFFAFILFFISSTALFSLIWPKGNFDSARPNDLCIVIYNSGGRGGFLGYSLFIFERPVGSFSRIMRPLLLYNAPNYLDIPTDITGINSIELPATITLKGNTGAIKDFQTDDLKWWSPRKGKAGLPTGVVVEIVNDNFPEFTSCKLIEQKWGKKKIDDGFGNISYKDTVTSDSRGFLSFYRKEIDLIFWRKYADDALSQIQEFNGIVQKNKNAPWEFAIELK